MVVDLHQVDEAVAAKHNVPEGTKLLTYDFVPVTDEETNVLRSERSKEVLKKLGRPIQIVQGLLIGLAEE